MRQKELIRIYDATVTSEKGHALENFSLSVYRGEILGIFGTRYAGKHTLLHLLSGKKTPEHGYLFTDGVRMEPEPFQKFAGTHTIMVEKESMLVEDLSIWENAAALGGSRRGGILYRASAQRAMTRVLLEEYGLSFDVDRSVRELSAMQRMMLEIVLRLSKKNTLLLADLYRMEGSIYDRYDFGNLLLRLLARGMAVLLCGQ